MDNSGLQTLAGVDAAGKPLFRIAAGPDGDFVLCAPDRPVPEPLRELDADERTRLAALSAQPAVVVEADDGSYVVLAEGGAPDLERYLPLGLEDVELLAGAGATAKFGRRDDDVLLLTPWAHDDEMVVVDLDAEEFADVPVVERDEGGSLTWHRGQVDAVLELFVMRELQRLDVEPGVRVGILSNLFGECRGVLDGEPLVPHEDVRNQTVMTTDALLDDAATLAEAADRLRAIGDRLALAATQGWKLVEPIRQGVVLVDRADD